MHPIKIELTNFGRFRGDHVLDLEGKEVIGVAGPNGSAKSTLIVDSMTAAFFGYVQRSSMQRIISRGETEMRVAYTLSDGARIECGWSGGKGYVELSGWEGAQSAHTGRAVVDLIGMGREDFLATRLFVQGDTSRLAGSRPAERKKLVESWVARALWAKAHAVVGEEMKSARREVQRLEGVLEGLQGDDGDEDPGDPGILAKRIKVLTSQLVKRQASLDTLEQPDEPEELQPARDAVAVADQAGRTAKRNLRSFSGECPITGGECPVADDIEADTASRRRKLKEARERWQIAHRQEQKWTGCFDVAVAKWQAEDEELTDRRDKIRDQLADAREEYAAVAERAKAAKERAQKVEKAEADMSEARSQVAVLLYCSRMFGRDGIPSDEMRDAMDTAEGIANDVILNALGVPYRTSFRHGRELKRWAEWCECGSESRVKSECRHCGDSWPKARDDKLEVLVTDEHGDDYEFAEESGGRKDVVSLALRLAFAQQLGSLRVAVCDEVFRHLDRSVRGDVASFLCGGRFRALGYEQVFILSHDDKLLGAAPNLLRVERVGKGSVFRWER